MSFVCTGLFPPVIGRRDLLSIVQSVPKLSSEWSVFAAALYGVGITACWGGLE
jgi:hypothetical protein